MRNNRPAALPNDLLDAALCRAPEVVLRRIAGETLLIPVKGKVADMRRIFVLNAVGERIWSALGESRPLRDIAREITETFDVAPELAAADAAEFVAQLLDAGLVTR